MRKFFFIISIVFVGLFFGAVTILAQTTESELEEILDTGDNAICVEVDGYLTCCAGTISECEAQLQEEHPGRTQFREFDRQSCMYASEGRRRVGWIWNSDTATCESEGGSAPLPAPEITYPIAELENCSDKATCFGYCENQENSGQCLEFSKDHQLLSEKEILLAEKILGVKDGPGGCNSQASCKNYCDDVSHIDECLVFAEANGIMEEEELEEAKKVRTAIQSGAKLPGGCRNKNECDNYCQNPDNMDECLAFAEAAGFIPPDELEQARKFIPLMKSGQTPGKCKTKAECEAYCEADGNFNECLDFAEKNGLIPEEERKNIEAFKKAGGKGPGGCVGRQCEAYCENPVNQEVCFSWAKENGILKEEDIQRMEQGRQQLEKVIAEAPVEVQECLETVLGPGGLEQLRSEKFFGGEAIGEKIRTCFEGFMTQMGGTFGGPGEPGGPMGDFSGPGGCKGLDECMSYCKDRPEECQNFTPPGGGPGGGQGGFPGGGQGRVEECAKSGGDWDGSRCDFGASECVKQGGAWDGKTCNFPEDSFSGIQCEFPPCGSTDVPKTGTDFNAQGSFINPMATSENCLKQGGDWFGEKCSFERRECVSQGGEFRDGKCYFINPLDTVEGCIKQGGDWIGSRCDFGTSECTKQGGIWDGKTCNFPQYNSPSPY